MPTARQSRKKEVLFVSAGLGLEGGGTALVGRLLLKVVEVVAKEAGLGIRVLNLGEVVPFWEGQAKSFSRSQMSLASAIMRSQIGGRVSAVVFDFLGPARVQAFLPSLLRKPYLVFIHGVEVWRDLGWQRRRALQGATVLLSNSGYTQRRAKEWTPQLPDAVPVGLALEERPPSGRLEEDVLAQAGEGFVLIVGRMSTVERYKGHDSLLQAMQELVRKRPSAKLVVVGGGDDKGRLIAKAESLGLAENTYFTGFISEQTLAALYRKCSFFVLPSKDEGFGLVYLEAMKWGKACIGAQGGAVEEIVEDGKTGLLVPYGSPDSLARTMEKLFADGVFRDALGLSGFRRWQNRFLFKHFSQKCMPHIRSLLGPSTLSGKH